MSSVNKVIIVGNMGNVPKTFQIGNNKPFAMLQLATNKKWKKDGVKHQHTDWLPVMLTNSSLTFAQKYIGKGDEIYVEGELRTRISLDKSGNKQYRTYVKAFKIQPMRTKSKQITESDVDTSEDIEDEIDDETINSDTPF